MLLGLLNDIKASIPSDPEVALRYCAIAINYLDKHKDSTEFTPRVRIGDVFKSITHVINRDYRVVDVRPPVGDLRVTLEEVGHAGVLKYYTEPMLFNPAHYTRVVKDETAPTQSVESEPERPFPKVVHKIKA